MSDDQSTIQLVSNPVEQYLTNQLSARELVCIIDDLVSQDRLQGLNPQSAQAVADLHEALALSVPDEPTRRQEPGIFIGEEELRERAARFIAIIGLMHRTDSGA